MSKSSCTLTQNVLPNHKLQSQTSFASTKSSVLSSCRICLSSILDPAVLSCRHRFCEACLFQYWDDSNKPAFIVCPLCRANVYKVDFMKKEDISATEDFRRTFNALPKISSTGHKVSNVIFYVKLILFIIMMYCVFNWIHIPMELLIIAWNILIKIDNQV